LYSFVLLLLQEMTDGPTCGADNWAV